MKKRTSRMLKKQPGYAEIDQDEHFWFIAGYTSGGVPYGVSWEEAHTEGLIEEEEQEEMNQEDYPF